MGVSNMVGWLFLLISICQKVRELIGFCCGFWLAFYFIRCCSCLFVFFMLGADWILGFHVFAIVWCAGLVDSLFSFFLVVMWMLSWLVWWESDVGMVGYLLLLLFCYCV